MAEFVSGNTAPTLKVPCEDGDGNAIDLTGCTVKLRWQQAAGSIAEVNMTVIDAPGGICTYKFLAGELIAPGMAFEIEITDADGFTVSNGDLVTVNVRAKLQ